MTSQKLLAYCQTIRSASSGEDAALLEALCACAVSEACQNQLLSAVEDIRRQGADVGFVMFDKASGMTLSLNADREFFGASTVKALWVTYLFQEQFEKGIVEWDRYLAVYVEWCIAQSRNKSYTVLRSNYGSEEGFQEWLAQVGVRYISSWDYCTPRELALAWTHMLEYTDSNGALVDAWKAAFDHSDCSFVREAVGDIATVYSKPGFVPKSDCRPNTYDDASIVVDRDGRHYLVAIMSTMYPYGDCSALRDLAVALDAIHNEWHDAAKTHPWTMPCSSMETLTEMLSI